jgi:hypothetical protein
MALSPSPAWAPSNLRQPYSSSFQLLESDSDREACIARSAMSRRKAEVQGSALDVDEGSWAGEALKRGRPFRDYCTGEGRFGAKERGRVAGLQFDFRF